MEPSPSFRAHSLAVTCVLVHGDRLYSASRDRSIRVWNLNGQMDCLLRLTGHTDAVTCLLLCEGNTLVTGSLDRTVRFWDSNDGRPIQTMPGHEGAVWGLAWCAPDVLSCSQDGTIRSWSLASQHGRVCSAQQWSDPTHGFGARMSAAFQALEVSSGRIFGGNDDSNVYEYDLNSRSIVGVYQGHSAPVLALAVNGNHLVSTSADSTARYWDCTSRMCEVSVTLWNPVSCIAQQPGRLVFCLAGARGTVHLWEPTVGCELRGDVEISPGVGVSSLWATEASVMVGCEDGTITLSLLSGCPGLESPGPRVSHPGREHSHRQGSAHWGDERQRHFRADTPALQHAERERSRAVAELAAAQQVAAQYSRERSRAVAELAAAHRLTLELRACEESALLDTACLRSENRELKERLSSLQVRQFELQLANDLLEESATAHQHTQHIISQQAVRIEFLEKASAADNLASEAAISEARAAALKGQEPKQLWPKLIPNSIKMVANVLRRICYASTELALSSCVRWWAARMLFAPRTAPPIVLSLKERVQNMRRKQLDSNRASKIKSVVVEKWVALSIGNSLGARLHELDELRRGVMRHVLSNWILSVWPQSFRPIDSMLNTV
eukprot:TRINITY_DN11005_c0_g1_i2.p1 TRINITY_DN11005_c0_g1~~TRINITY_DN11005_c0_g1_i2.p1  ORF type:complete len:613 (+),score=73.67 TRINITY_DN11005_c0_g1_i2:100-1938(+)